MTVSVMPNWKRDSTPEEFFYECAMIARTAPEKCSRIVVVSQELVDDKVKTHVWHHGQRETSLCVGVLEMGKMALYSESGT